MGIMRKIINWCDNTMDAGCSENKPHKVFASGFVEGFCDAAVVLYIPLVVGVCLIRKQLEE